VRKRRKPLSGTAEALSQLPRRALHVPARTLELAASVPRRRVGAVPGVLPEIPEADQTPARIRIFTYSADDFDERGDLSAEDAAALRADGGTLWVDVVGVRDPAAMRALAEAFALHPLVQEDLVNTHQRPKVEAYAETPERDTQLFIVAKMLQVAPGEGRDIQVEQVGFVLGHGYLLTFQELPGDVFEPIRERIRQNSGRLRRRGADYLAYCLLDVIVDHYFVVMEQIGEAIDALEAEIVTEPVREHQHQIRAFRKSVLFLRRSIWPLREVIGTLLRDESSLIDDHTRVYLRDAYDHTIQVVEVMEGFRDVLSTLNDLYLSSLSHRLNEVMKVLTIVGTIFIPLSFLAGIYGMNFEYMPELDYPYAYFIFLGVVALLLIGSLAFFKRRGWI
jgi:magnesium transporter